MTHLVHQGHLPILPVDDHVEDAELAANRTAPPGLAKALADAVQGEVRFDRATRAMYATDGSNYRHPPIGVVRPRSVDDILTVLEVCRHFDVPVLSRGGGTSLAGQCCNVAVIMDMTKYLRGIIAIDPAERTATVEPGCVLDDLNRALLPHALVFAPDPSTHAQCSLGGMIGNNSCGVHSVMSGRTADNVRSLDVVTYDGVRMTVGRTSDAELRAIVSEGGRRAEIYAGLVAIRDRYAPLIRDRYPDIPRRVSGYNLDELLPERFFNVARALVGTEGTCVTILSATVELLHRPPHRSMVVLGYDSVYEAADHIDEVMAQGPIGLEGLDRKLVNHAKKKKLHVDAMGELPDGDGWLVVEFGGDTKDEAKDRAERLLRAIAKEKRPPRARVYLEHEQMQKVWEVRESGLGSTARVPGEPDAWEGWEDAAVPPRRLGLYLRDFRRLLQRYEYDTALYGHFGQGCVHCRINFDFSTKEGVAHFRAFIDEASDLVLSHGGSLSGEHGDGQSRAELLPKMFGTELIEAFRKFKSLWDPRHKMNPNRIVDAPPIASALRVGPHHHPWDPPTRLHFGGEDKNSFSRAMTRCVGVGKCRAEEKGTMCPSWRATHEEAHSTRGRAHLLYEMLEHDVMTDGWNDAGVKEALDLCLACKGCKKDCPVNVDMAAYKAEFLSHYHEAHGRPRQAYAFGYIDIWSRLAELWPSAVNFFGHTPPFDSLAKWMAGVHPAREIPSFAKKTFRRSFLERVAHESGAHRDGAHDASDAGGARSFRRDGAELVLLWPDTFNDHFFPEILDAAAYSLDAAGFVVDIPRARVCCGRPVYDFGMIERGRRLLRHTLDVLAPFIDAEVPVVFAEPSCMAVFMDELGKIFPDDARAQKLPSLCYSVAHFLDERAPHALPASLSGRAVIHGHCHEKALSDLSSEKRVLERLGLDVQLLPSGCCGMAGSFGFERDKYEVSMAVAEGDLFQKLHDDRNQNALIVADGFSCREQVQQGMHKRAHHAAEIVQAALRTQRARELSPTSEEKREPALTTSEETAAVTRG